MKKLLILLLAMYAPTICASRRNSEVNLTDLLKETASQRKNNTTSTRTTALKPMQTPSSGGMHSLHSTHNDNQRKRNIALLKKINKKAKNALSENKEILDARRNNSDSSSNGEWTKWYIGAIIVACIAVVGLIYLVADKRNNKPRKWVGGKSKNSFLG